MEELCKIDKRIEELNLLKGCVDSIDMKKVIEDSIDTMKEAKKAIKDGFELAQYASYSEIVGGINVNKSSIRKFSDKVFNHNHNLLDEVCE